MKAVGVRVPPSALQFRIKNEELTQHGIYMNLEQIRQHAARVNLAHVAEIWESIVDLMQITDYKTEYQMSARNAIFA